MAFIITQKSNLAARLRENSIGKKKSVMTDRCLEWGDYLKRDVGRWGNFFLLVDILLEYSHLTQHFDLDISEMLNRLETKAL